jgi:hypothetical protein
MPPSPPLEDAMSPPKFFKDGKLPPMRIGDWVIVLSHDVMESEDFLDEWRGVLSDEGSSSETTKRAVEILESHGSTGRMVARTDDTITLDDGDIKETYDIEDVVCVCVDEGF